MVDFQRGDELVDHILNDRHQAYGYFMDVAAVATALRAVIRDRRPDLLPDQEEALNMICVKIARIVNGDPNHLDSWRDICGYSQLVIDRLEGRSR
jgi:hypothetical protein